MNEFYCVDNLSTENMILNFFFALFGSITFVLLHFIYFNILGNNKGIYE